LYAIPTEGVKAELAPFYITST